MELVPGTDVAMPLVMTRTLFALLTICHLAIGCRQPVEHVDPEGDAAHVDPEGSGGYTVEGLSSLEAEPGAALESAVLASEVEAAPIPEDRLGAPRGFSFVVQGADGPVVVLAPNVDPALAVGTVELTPGVDGGPFLLHRELAPEAMASSAVSGSRGARYVLRDAVGPVCVATLAEPEVLVRAVPPHDLWAGFHGEADFPAVDDERMASALWELARHDGRIVSALADTEGDCAGALWAHPEHTPAATVFANAGVVDGGVALEAVDAFRALPAHETLQAEFADYREEAGSWDESEDTTMLVRRFDGGGRTLYAVSASAGYGCGDFMASLFAVFERDAEGTLVPRSVGQLDRAPVAVFDLEGDGELELSFGDVLSVGSGEEQRFIDVEVPFFDCPC